MLPKHRRLPVQEFVAEEKPTKKASSRYFSLRARKNNTQKNRIGVVVGAKVHKQATVRNTLKRRVLSHAPKWKEEGLDLVVYILPPAETLGRKDFYRELDEVISKLYNKFV